MRGVNLSRGDSQPELATLLHRALSEAIGPSGAPAQLTFLKALHTIVWAFMVACIVGIFVFSSTGRFGWAVLMIGIVVVEVVVLALNGWQCPLTPMAARYTQSREPNFDIYLPRWLAKHNKGIFGSLFVAGVAYCLFQWLG